MASKLVQGLGDLLAGGDETRRQAVVLAADCQLTGFLRPSLGLLLDHAGGALERVASGNAEEGRAKLARLSPVHGREKGEEGSVELPRAGEDGAGLGIGRVGEVPVVVADSHQPGLEQGGREQAHHARIPPVGLPFEVAHQVSASGGKAFLLAAGKLRLEHGEKAGVLV